MAEDPVRSDVAHLYRRAGFGASPDELDRAAAQGFAATVEQLLDRSGADAGADAVAAPSFAVTGIRELAGGAARQADVANHLRDDRRALVGWWLDRLVASTSPLREKLTLLWHGHFATGLQKVRVAAYMYGQNQLFRALGAGSFEQLTQAVAKDPAMLIWLDANTNVKSHPNENFARELMELFTLGIGNYSEADVKEAARCFTGWTLNGQNNTFLLRPALHDAGTKTVLGQTGPWGGEDVIRIATQTDASMRFVAAKLWSHLAYPVTAADPVVADLLPHATGALDITGVLRALFLHPQFRSAQARNGLVKQPIEYAVGTFRAFALRPADQPDAVAQLGALGQIPFDPPNVGGWPQNGYWLSTAAALGRLRFAARVAARADLSDLARQPASDRAAALSRLLSVEWTPGTASALSGATDVRAAVTLALTAPEYVLN